MRLTSEKELKYSEQGDQDSATTATDFIPASDLVLLSVLEELTTPVTVDEVVDSLVHPADPSVNTWADVHERLHQERLPALDDAGDIDFDPERGTITALGPDQPNDQLVSRAFVGAVSITLLVVLFVII
ncbi:hypothetical protein [Halostagnicola bangensis]